MMGAGGFSLLGHSCQFQTRAAISWIKFEGFVKILLRGLPLSQKTVGATGDTEILRAGLRFIREVGQLRQFLLGPPCVAQAA
jgi:hypothetical protein